jgi:hypothetical protein
LERRQRVEKKCWNIRENNFGKKKKKGSNCSGEYLSLSEVLQLEEPGLSPLL